MASKGVSMSELIDFNEKRKDSIENKKRNFERIFFTEFLGSYAEIDEEGNKHQVKIMDISHDGLSFNIPKGPSQKAIFKEDDEVTLRLYFTRESFLPLVVSVKYFHEYQDDKGKKYWKFGGQFDKSLPSFQAVKPFVEFLYKFAEYACVDKGDPIVYFL